MNVVNHASTYIQYIYAYYLVSHPSPYSLERGRGGMKGCMVTCKYIQDVVRNSPPPFHWMSFDSFLQKIPLPPLVQSWGLKCVRVCMCVLCVCVRVCVCVVCMCVCCVCVWCVCCVCVFVCACAYVHVRVLICKSGVAQGNLCPQQWTITAVIISHRH